MSRPAGVLRRLWPPALVLAAILLAWWAVTDARLVSGLLLPAPASVLRRLMENFTTGEIWPHLAYTLSAVLGGFALGSMVALVAALAIASSRIAEHLLMAHLVAFQSIPKVSIAPLIFLWLGFGVASSVTIVALVCFFPVFTNALAGIRAVDGNLLALYRVHGASRLRMIVRVALPSALPQLMTGLQVALVFSLLAAVVMEFITGTQGLGFLIENSANTWDTAQGFASIMVLAALGITGSVLMRRARARLVFWERDSHAQPGAGA
jgi:NitT/TauT family transport system permease protein